MQILLTGATGLLGEAFLRLLSDGAHQVTAVTRETMDLSNLSSVSEYLSDADFDLLINPAGMTGLEQCLDAPELAYTVNAEAPALMARICAEKGAKMVHFSTDYVFCGGYDKSLLETDSTEPVSDYGKSKLAGELAVLQHDESVLVCRVSWLFGKGRAAVIDQVYQKTLAGEQMEYITDKWSVPTYADDVVSAVMALVELEQSGVYHVCSDDAPVSWWEYAHGVSTLAYELGRVSQTSVIGKTKLKDIQAFRAARPTHTAMSCNKLKDTGISMRPWKEAAREFINTQL
mgnify:CR=1 FL=1